MFNANIQQKHAMLSRERLLPRWLHRQFWLMPAPPQSPRSSTRSRRN